EASAVGLEQRRTLWNGHFDDRDFLHTSLPLEPPTARGAQVAGPVALAPVGDEVALAPVFEHGDGDGVPAPAAATAYRQHRDQRSAEQRHQAVGDVLLHPRRLEVVTIAHGRLPCILATLQAHLNLLGHSGGGEAPA